MDFASSSSLRQDVNKGNATVASEAAPEATPEATHPAVPGVVPSIRKRDHAADAKRATLSLFPVSIGTTSRSMGGSSIRASSETHYVIAINSPPASHQLLILLTTDRPATAMLPNSGIISQWRMSLCIYEIPSYLSL